MRIALFLYGWLLLSFVWGQQSLFDQVDSLDAKAKAYYFSGDYDSSMVFMNEAIELLKPTDSTDKLSKFYFQKGRLLNLSGRLDEALEYFDKSLNLTTDSLTYAMVLNSKAATFYNNYEIEEAFELFEESIGIRERVHDTYIGDAYWNIAFVYLKEEDTTTFIEKMKLARDAYATLSSPYGIGSMYFAMGIIHDDAEQFEEAVKCYDSVIVNYRKLNIIDYIAWAQNNKSRDLLVLGRINEALTYADSSYYYGKYSNSFDRMSKAAQQLSLVYEAKGNHQKALEYYKLYESLLDSLANEESAKSIIKNKYSVSYEKKFLKDSLMNAEKLKVESLKSEKQAAEIKAKTTQQIALVIGVIIIGLFLVFVFLKFKESQRQKKVIEEQKYVVEKQKLIVEEQKAEVESQKIELEATHLQLKEHHKEIADSIMYAKRIQEAIMPSMNAMDAALKNGFVLYLPKDVVAGDFFWMEQIDEVTYYAAADCTGHGVPGAMVSVVCSNALNKALLEEGIRDTGKLLDRTREIVIDRLAKSGEEVKDGMDISLCALNNRTKELKWAGANNPLWILRKGASVFEEIKANKQPIGKYADPKPFTEHKLQLNEGDSIYIFTDGYQDQFGGPQGKKFKAAQLKELILSNDKLSMNEQMEMLKLKFMEWKGTVEQIDDVCIIGVRV